MTIKLINHGDYGELLLEGRLDSLTVLDVEKIFEKVTQEYREIVLNLKDLQYISSAGLRLIKITYMALKKKDGNLALKNVNKMCMEVFEMTGFAGFLTFI